MGNQHSTSHAALKPRKNVHWKSAVRPAPPGKPQIIPLQSDDEPNAITLKWTPAVHDGGASLQGYQVECNRLGTREWIRTSPPVVIRPELVLTGLEPPHKYQFRVASLNAVGLSEYSELSDVLNISSDRLHEPPVFLKNLEDITALENEKTEFLVTFTGSPAPSIAWFKDDYEIFSSRRTAITTSESSSILIFHQTLASDEGEIKCTATNRSGHAVVKAHLSLESAPKLRYPRQYEDGLLYEINETVFLKTAVVGKPTPSVEWRHNGQPLIQDERKVIINTPKSSMLKIHAARRSDRGDYQINAKNIIGEDTAAFLVTITAPPDPPRSVSVARQVDKSVTLNWEPPEDDGGCRIGNYVVEYYRTGWNVWLKATTSRKTNATLFDLIEGSEYRFRVKAESPYGMSAPSVESASVRIPGRPVDMEFLAIESRIINEVLTREDGEEPSVSPVPRRKRAQRSPTDVTAKRRSNETKVMTSSKNHTNSNEFLLVLYPGSHLADRAEKRKSFQLDLEDALSPPPISLSAPELSTRNIMPFNALRCAVSSTELLHEKAMARFYKVVEMKEEQNKNKNNISNSISNQVEQKHDIPRGNNKDLAIDDLSIKNNHKNDVTINKQPAITVKPSSLDDKIGSDNFQQASQDSDVSHGRWQSMSFDEDYTASTVSSEEDYSEEDSLNGDADRSILLTIDEEIYNPRDKVARPSPIKESVEEGLDEDEKLEIETTRLVPLPDPNFIPRPILKRRDLDIPLPEIRPISAKKSEKKEKLTIFRKITKMPMQKSLSFPRILKKEPETAEKKNTAYQKPITENKTEKTTEDKLDDGGRTVIEYYGNIVKEYGSNKKPVTPLYLNTDDLKTVAEKQMNENKVKSKEKETKTQKKKLPNKGNIAKNTRPKSSASTPVLNKSKLKYPTDTTESQSQSAMLKSKEKQKSFNENCTQQVILKKTERATIVIPINYKELEEQAKVNVRSAIDYAVDVCLLLLAFWVYFFKDERLAIPLLTLIIYRQLQETVLFNIPEWVENYTPTWLKKQSS